MTSSSKSINRTRSRGRLLQGVSLLAVVSLLDPAVGAAQTAALLRGVGHTATSAGVPAIVAPAASALPGAASMASASARALLHQNAASQAVSLATQAQAAARAAAAALSSGVPNGLGVGGLDPVKNPVAASADPTGLSTWQGASAPVQTQSGTQTDVTITQTSSRAILSWTTFNVGANTTLTFDQTSGGVAQPSWIALNRVVGQIDPTTGLRNAGSAPAPSQILGKIKADGEVLVLNPNGVLFGATAQVNTYSLVATSLDIGQALSAGAAVAPLTIGQRNQNFLTYGLLGYAQQASTNAQGSAFTFSAEATSAATYDPTLEGAVTIDAGAQISSADSGFLLFLAPKVTNGGLLSSPDGEVGLQSGREITLQPSEGSPTSVDPNVRGFVLSALNRSDADGNYVDNTTTGLIQATDGYVSLGGTDSGAVINAGVLQSSTSVSRNGFVRLSGQDIELAPGSTISITPDDTAGTIPQSTSSLASFQSSKISIGNVDSRIDIGADSLIYAPSANVDIGDDPGATTSDDSLAIGDSRIFVDSGAVIDVSGLKNVLIPASRNSIQISPVTANDLQNTPNYKNSFLAGATVYLDPRLSGVRADGVAWVGSPLVSAASYDQQVGVSASELMTKGGNVTLGVASFAGRADASSTPDIIVKPDAVIDISGGWVTYQAGNVQTTRLIDASGAVVDISQANPNATYIGIYTGYVASQPHWGVSQTYADPILLGPTYEGAYSEGRDAGSLTLKGSAIALDGTVYADAFAGAQQRLDAQAGTAKSSLYGDNRLLQAAPSQLPSGGFLSIQAYGVETAGTPTGGADIEITSGAAGSSTANLAYGQTPTIDASGDLSVAARDPASALASDRRDSILLSGSALSGMGLGDISLQTSGAVTVDQGATVTLDPGGAFDALAGRAISIDGSVDTAGGRITLTTAQLGQGSVFTPSAAVLGSYDINVNGVLSTAGQWINDDGALVGALNGAAFLNGGSISLTAAPRVTLDSAVASVSDTLSGAAPTVNTDISGSVLINQGALIDVAGGGYVAPDGTLTLTSKGGNLTLSAATTYFQLTQDVNQQAGGISGFRVTDNLDLGGTALVAVNPDTINARVSIASGSIEADGFAGGGTFTLTTPQITFGSTPAATGTALPLDFFNTAGFANYIITSYKTALLANTFDNGLGGYNAVLQTQTLNVGAGQVLNLTQSGFSPLVNDTQMAALRGLTTGGDLYSVLTPSTPVAAWDQAPVSLTLGGLIELDVAPTGTVTGAAGASLTVSKLLNQGTIRLPGGVLTQSQVLPGIDVGSAAVAVNDLGQVFGENGAGQAQEGDLNLLGAQGLLSNGGIGVLTNAQLASQDGVYLLAALGQDVGVQLAPGSITDLSGEAIINPRARVIALTGGASFVTGRLVNGGILQSLNPGTTGVNLFQTPVGQSVYATENAVGVRTGEMIAATGATIDVAGAAAVFDLQTTTSSIGAGSSFQSTAVWSDAGALNFGGGALLQNVTLLAAGGAPQALGATLTIPNLVLTQHDTGSAAANTLSADQIESAGISTLVAEGSLTTDGDVTLQLGRAFFLTSANYGGVAGQTLSTAAGRDALAPIVGATGDLSIAAPYIAFDSNFQTVSTPVSGVIAGNIATFSADTIDLFGAVRFDQSLSSVNLIAQDDLRLSGVQPWQLTFNVQSSSVSNSLVGQLVVNGDLNITAAQVYPTTGSTFSVSSAATAGTITFAKTPGSTPAAPYSAGGDLLVQAANIIQGGVLRAPLGTLTLGSNTALTQTSNGSTTTFAPPTTSVELLAGSTTSVSADGLSIPYGTTTDQTEWYFAPTSANPLTAPPAGVLSLAGDGVNIAAGATVDVSGGGDVYAYEFIAGTGGSHDVLSQFNTDSFSSDGGYQYADHRQVYAIVPGLSNATAAAYDPIYSANYASLYGASAVGQRVYLNGGPGLTAGWYTLLPAQYALLPGGMRVVQDTSATSTPAVGGQTLKDGTIVVAGQYGVAGTSSRESTVETFDVQSQSTFLKYSDIALTSANTQFAADAAHNGVAVPRLPVDAGRLVLDPVSSLDILSPIVTTPGTGGRGAQADISGANLDIVDQATGVTTPGVITLTADELTQLNAASLLLGGVRTENSDGTTSLQVTAQSITVENSTAHPLSAPEVLLAVDGSGSTINLLMGADITATGSGDSSQTADYVITGGSGQTGHGALLRVANAAERLISRVNASSDPHPGQLLVGPYVTLSGTSILLDASGNVRVASTAKLTETNLAVGALNIGFGPAAVINGLNITPQLQTKFATATSLTLISPNPIAFLGDYASASGTGYTFNRLTLDAPGLLSPDQDNTTITATTVTLSNSGANLGACDTSSFGCGFGDLQIIAKAINFGGGMFNAYGFNDQIDLTAATGVYAQGAGGMNVGPSGLAIDAPFIGDEATASNTGSTTSAKAGLSFTSEGGQVTITNSSGAAANAPAGTPGATLAINAGYISVDGATLRATAGNLSLTSQGGIDITGAAVLETPGYSKSFGDAADAYSISAPGGLLSLTALGGDLNLASTTLLSVGGGAGQAGDLSLVATGAVNMNGALNASAPGGGAGFKLDTGSSFDLSAFEQQGGAAFDGNLLIRTGTGDLDLASGLTITAANVSLTADGGLVDIGGGINVSGVVGGDVNLVGAQGVTLESGSLIEARATGYAASDTRQASGGSVFIGVAGDGAIQVDSGAVIDVAALNTEGRLVPLASGGAGSYSYVPGDIGGDVTLRAPVIDGAGGETVNVAFAGQIDGASSIVLEGFKTFDLGDIAAGGGYAGVSQTDPSTITLDVNAAGSAGTPNFLADNAPGTLVNFIQSFNLAAAAPGLGGLTGMAAFHERPGVELDYSGAVVLASNWNLGAGTVNVAGAVAAGLMAPDPQLPGEYYVLPGDEAQVFSNYTTLTYRVGGQVTGEPGALTIRAGGNLTLNGSLTDGFFTFADQTDAGYLNLDLGGGTRQYQGYLTPTCATGTCSAVAGFDPTATDLPDNYVSVQFPGATGLSTQFNNPIPYSAAANSPGALGTLTDGTGDPIGSAEIFPLVTQGGATKVVDSWSYRLVAGADGSADPLHTAAGTPADLVVQGTNPYPLSATAPISSLGAVLDLAAGGLLETPTQWLNAYLVANPALTDTSTTFIDFSTAPGKAQSALRQAALSFFTDSTQATLQGDPTKPTGVSTTLQMAAAFMASLDFSSFSSGYRAPGSAPYTGSATAYAPTLVRTGAGNIALSASGDVDLRNGSALTYLKTNGAAATASTGLPTGGVAIYTAGHAVDMGLQTVVDATTGAMITLDASASGSSANPLATPPSLGYRYGAGADPSVPGVGYTGILLADPVYLTGGGDVSVSAGGDVLGRRDVWLENRIAANASNNTQYGYSWIGTSDQTWRTGSVGAITDIRIDPQLFQEGLGALGGGNITVTAVGNVSDISIVDDTSVATAQVATTTAGGPTGQALITLGGGDVTVAAAGSLLGGRIDVGSGQAAITVAGDIGSAGLIGPRGAQVQDTLRLRLTDATVDVVANGSIDLQGIRALGVLGSGQDIQNNLDALGFYSADAGVSLVADGAVTIDNAGADVVTPRASANGLVYNAVYPGSLEAASLTGSLDLATPGAFQTASAILLYPSPSGTLDLAAAGDIAPSTIAMLDTDPSLLPGVFSNFQANAEGILSGVAFLFPAVLPGTTDTERSALHNSTPTHQNDAVPNRIYAGQDINDMILSTPKQTRIGAGRDIVNMMFFGQNLASTDITRIVAGRDITATTTLVQPVIGLPDVLGAALPAVQGNTFVIGGPGAFFLEAGRDAGPFLNSAVTNGFTSEAGTTVAAGTQTYGGGVLSVGNLWDPWLSQTGADIYTEFGVAKGENFSALVEAYLDPANFATMPDYLFAQVSNIAGVATADRTQQIYEPVLIAWMKANDSAALVSAFGTADVTYQQAYQAFLALPALQQQMFLLKNVYFNELAQTSIPSGSSYKNYARGYQAVNNLFPASLGYTANNLTGGSNGASTTVSTGNLDLRLATIQTDQGGNIFILGPGGHVLAGSTVATAQQAARRAYDGGVLFNGGGVNVPLPSTISSIPVGDEGILTLQGGGIYSFTDTNFLLNQSRLFTETGGDIVMWSSNGDLNAGQGPKTSVDFPPVVVTIDQNGYAQVDQGSAVSGAGIAAFEPAPGVPAPNVYLIAPRGTVDAGAAGVRVAGNLFIAANAVANADNFKVSGTSFGIPVSGAVNVGAQTSAGAAAAAAAQNAQAVASGGGPKEQRSTITVVPEGYDPETCPPDDKTCKPKT